MTLRNCPPDDRVSIADAGACIDMRGGRPGGPPPTTVIPLSMLSYVRLACACGAAIEVAVTFFSRRPTALVCPGCSRVFRRPRSEQDGEDAFDRLVAALRDVRDLDPSADIAFISHGKQNVVIPESAIKEVEVSGPPQLVCFETGHVKPLTPPVNLPGAAGRPTATPPARQPLLATGAGSVVKALPRTVSGRQPQPR
jgi:hypothetical protein